MNNELPPVCGVIWFFSFILMWLFVSWLLAKIGGWSELAEKFMTDDAPNGWRWFRSLDLNTVRYSGSCRIAFSDGGLFLGTIFPFIFAHPRLFIPKSEIKYITVEKILWYEFYAFEIKSCPYLKMKLSKREGEELKRLVS